MGTGRAGDQRGWASGVQSPPQIFEIKTEKYPKFTFKKLPESYHEYADPREARKAEVLGYVLPIKQVKYFLDLWDNRKLRVGQTEALMSTNHLEAFNAKLYS